MPMRPACWSPTSTGAAPLPTCTAPGRCCPSRTSARIHGFVLNKFRGDASLLAPGAAAPAGAHRRAHRGHLPMWWHHGLPEEDGCVRRPQPREGARGAVHTTVAVVAYPRISNLDEFQPLKNVPGVRLHWVRSPADSGLRVATGSCCPAPRPPAPTWPGCARRAWTAPSPRTPRGRRGAGHLRRPADAGRGADRPARHRRQRTRPGPAAAGHRVRARQDRAAHQRASAADRRLGAALGRACSRATKSTTARPPSTPPWPPRATWRARSCPASPGRTRRAMCWACTCMVCSRTPPCCTPCLAPRRPRSIPCSTAWPMGSDPAAHRATGIPNRANSTQPAT
jgi:hypothetical protein